MRPTDTFPAIFAGVDGGGSRTRVVLASADGAICELGHSAGSNPCEFGLAETQSRIRGGIDEAWRKIGTAPRPLAGIFLGIAGLAAFRARTGSAVFDPSLVPVQGDAFVEWDHDLRIALAGGLSGGEGIVLIAGTGSSGYGRNATGVTWQVGGWGFLLDDVGSGSWLGREALKLVCRAYDGRGEKTILTEWLRVECGIDSAAAAVNFLRAKENLRATLAGFVPLIFRARDEKDLVAVQLVAHGASELAKIVLAVGAKLFSGAAADAVFSGGLSRDSEYFKQVKVDVAQSSEINVVRGAYQPVAGALLLALQSGRLKPEPKLLEKLAALAIE